MQSAAHHAAGGGHDLAHVLHERWSWVVQLFIPERHHGYEWIYMSLAVVAGLAYLFHRATGQLSPYPKGLQNFAEMLYEWLEQFVCGIIGPEQGKAYVPFIGTIFIFILTMNLIGLVPGLVSPTADLNCTFAMGLMVFFSVQIIAIANLGPKDWLLHLCGEPLWMAPLMFPIHVIGELAKPLSLACRLFGNIFGEDQVIINLTALSIVIFQHTYVPIPLQFPLLVFGMFTSLVQALVFSMLATIYISTFISGHGEHHAEHDHRPAHATGAATGGYP
jgi:F-type H+-transporting ATPase subunit a